MGGLLLGADVVLVLLFLSGYAARYLHPDTLWWTQLVALGLPLLALGVVAATAVVAVLAWRRGPRERMLLAAHLVLCVLAGVRFFPAAWLRGGATAGGLVVMTFNAAPGASDPRAGAVMQALVGRERPHLLALQEVEVDFLAVPDALAAEAGARVEFGLSAPPLVGPLLSDSAYALPVSGREGGQPFKVERPVFTRLPWTEVAWPALGENRYGRPQTFTRTVVEWEGQPIAVYNVHLWAHSPVRPWDDVDEDDRPVTPRDVLELYRRDFFQRAREAELVRMVLAGEALPYLLVGDLNSTPHQWTYAHLTRGLHDAYHDAGRGPSTTRPSAIPLLRIDYVLASPGWEVLDAYTVDVPIYSDHRPLVARLALRSAPEAAARTGSPLPPPPPR